MLDGHGSVGRVMKPGSDEPWHDIESGDIPYAVLEFGSFLGMRTGRSPIPWSVLKHQDIRPSECIETET